MKIIDFKRKGNVVRFFLGADELKDWWGDDWADCPYDCYAGKVYDEYVSGHKDIAFDFDDLVLEPCDGVLHCWLSKGDMIKRRVPCVIVVPKALADDSWETSFAHWVSADGVRRFYFGDKMEASENDDGYSETAK